MRNRSQGDPPATDGPGQRSRATWLLATACILVILVAVLLPRHRSDQSTASTSSTNPDAISTAGQPTPPTDFSARLPRVSSGPRLTAEEIVTNKMTQFARSRRALARAMAEHAKMSLPQEFERFFDAAEAGRYDEMSAIYKSLRAKRENGTDKSWYGPQWRTIIETQGAADAAHNWPAQKLLDYGNSVLGSLRPGMIYAGGTDPGCFIPTLLNETSEGDRHIVLTQNALADGTYLEYLDFLYHDRMKPLTQDDSQRTFQEYMEDAKKRYQHDRQFPDESKQLRPGEDVREVDNKFQVSGQVAVMAINEKLFQTLMQNNSGVSFAMEESFPFKSAYVNAAPLGPIIELGAADGEKTLTPQRAAQSVDYWRTTAQQMFPDPPTADDADPRKAYSKMISSQAGLLLTRNYSAEAEQAFQLANQICPDSPETVFRYINMLVQQKRISDAIQVGQNAVTAAPQNKQFGDLLSQLRKMPH